MDRSDKASLLAHYEVCWWQAHHRKDKKMFIESMSQLYVLQFGIPLNKAKIAVLLRVKAAELHDIAEREEDAGNTVKAEIYWKKVEKYLRRHFRELLSSTDFANES